MTPKIQSRKVVRPRLREIFSVKKGWYVDPWYTAENINRRGMLVVIQQGGVCPVGKKRSKRSLPKKLRFLDTGDWKQVYIVQVYKNGLLQPYHIRAIDTGTNTCLPPLKIHVETNYFHDKRSHCTYNHIYKYVHQSKYTCL